MLDVIRRHSEAVSRNRACLRQAEEALRRAVVEGFRNGLTGHDLAEASGLPLAMIVVILTQEMRRPEFVPPETMSASESKP